MEAFGRRCLLRKIQSSKLFDYYITIFAEDTVHGTVDSANKRITTKLKHVWLKNIELKPIKPNWYTFNMKWNTWPPVNCLLPQIQYLDIHLEIKKTWAHECVEVTNSLRGWKNIFYRKVIVLVLFLIWDSFKESNSDFL